MPYDEIMRKYRNERPKSLIDKIDPHGLQGARISKSA